MATLGEPRKTTIKRLFAMSRNKCAFRNCKHPIIDVSGTVVGQVCHIKGSRPGSKRHDPSQSDEDRHGFDNLILLCPYHHTIIDDDEKSYTVERLTEIKQQHESADSPIDEPTDAQAQRLLATIDAVVNIANQSAPGAILQSGGSITGNTINFHAPVPYPPPSTPADDWPPFDPAVAFPSAKDAKVMVEPVCWRFRAAIEPPHDFGITTISRAAEAAILQVNYSNGTWPFPRSMRAARGVRDGDRLIWQHRYDVGARNVKGGEQFFCDRSGSFGFERATATDGSSPTVDMHLLTIDLALFLKYVVRCSDVLAKGGAMTPAISAEVRLIVPLRVGETAMPLFSHTMQAKPMTSARLSRSRAEAKTSVQRGRGDAEIERAASKLIDEIAASFDSSPLFPGMGGSGGSAPPFLELENVDMLVRRELEKVTE